MIPECPAVPVLTWHGCYADSWKGWIVDGAFAHPAKFARGLIRRILEHGIEQGYWQEGSLIGDPFGGVACGGVVSASLGFRWVGVELEEKFVGLGQENIELHRNWYEHGHPRPVLLQGDSRRFHEVVAEVGGAMTSPPFTIDQPCASQTKLMKGGYESFKGEGKRCGVMVSDENIQSLKTEPLDGALSSPPYATIAAGQGGLNHLPAREEGQQSGRAKEGSQDADQRYGEDPAQIARLKDSTLDGSVTSPPYADSIHDGNGIDASKLTGNKAGKNSQAKAEGYGDSAGQIGREAGETYWAAMAKVYASLFLALKPGGYAAIVVKDYVKEKARVPLCDDTLRLLCHVGFEPVERAHAMLVEHSAHDDLFHGTVTRKKERKSFFRRLAEKKGSPAIDYEEVLFVRKP